MGGTRDNEETERNGAIHTTGPSTQRGQALHAPWIPASAEMTGSSEILNGWHRHRNLVAKTKQSEPVGSTVTERWVAPQLKGGERNASNVGPSTQRGHPHNGAIHTTGTGTQRGQAHNGDRHTTGTGTQRGQARNGDRHATTMWGHPI